MSPRAGSRTVLPAPRRSPARAVAGSAEGAGEGGRSATPAPARLSYCATASPAPPRRTPQRALRTCPVRAGPVTDPGSPPTAAPSAGNTGSTENTPRAGAGRRNTWRPGLPGAGRTWLSHLVRPRLAPPPPHTGLRPLPSPRVCHAPRNPNRRFLPPHPSRSQSPPTCSHCRHPREGKGPDVRPVAKGNRRERRCGPRKS